MLQVSRGARAFIPSSGDHVQHFLGCDRHQAVVMRAASLLFSPSSKLMIVAQLIALTFVYLAALVATGEVGGEDLRVVARVVKAR